MSVPPAPKAGPSVPPPVSLGDGVDPVGHPLSSSPPATAAQNNVRAVFEQNYEFVWRALRRFGVPEADVDDAVQEVFVVVHRKLSEFAGRSRLSTWLYGIAYRVASEHLRRGYIRHEQGASELPDAQDPAQGPEERYQGREAREKLDEVLATLDEDKRAVFVLYELDALPVEQIAEVVGVPPATVYSRLRAARVDFDRALGRLRARWAHAALASSGGGGGSGRGGAR